MNRKTSNFVARIVGRVHQRSVEHHFACARTELQSGNVGMAAWHANRLCTLIDDGAPRPIDDIEQWQRNLIEFYNAAFRSRNHEAADAIMYQLANSSTKIALPKLFPISIEAFEWHDRESFGLARSYAHALHGALISFEDPTRAQRFLREAAGELTTIRLSTFNTDDQQLLGRLIVQVHSEIRDIAFRELQMLAKKRPLCDNDLDNFVDAVLNINAHLSRGKDEVQQKLLEAAIKNLESLDTHSSELEDELKTLIIGEHRPRLRLLQGRLPGQPHIRHRGPRLGREIGFSPPDPDAS